MIYEAIMKLNLTNNQTLSIDDQKHPHRSNPATK